MRPDRARKLLETCFVEKEETVEKTSDSMGELFVEQLAEKCPAISLSFSLTILDDLKRQMQVYAGCSIGEILADPNSNLILIKEIKEHHKLKANAASSKAEQHIATAVYFAAIAHAILHHGAQISEHSPEYLTNSLISLEKKKWITPDIRSLYDQAKDALSA